jgi:DNA-directed RNA polymerase specialized sigma24 family protein
MSNKRSQSDENAPEDDDRRPVDYARWQGIIRRIGPGLSQYFRNKKLPTNDHDIYDGLIDAIYKITSSKTWFDPDDEKNDRFVFTVAKNAVLNNLHKQRREVPLTFEIRVYPENDDIDERDEVEKAEHSDIAKELDEPKNMKEALTKSLLSLSKFEREFILDYVESPVPKTQAERQRAQRIRYKIAEEMRCLGYDSMSQKGRKGGEQ